MKNRAGFTLIELLIVIVILGLLASLVAPKMFGKEESSKIKIAQTQMKMLETSLDTFRLDVGSYPDNLNELLKSDKKGWGIRMFTAQHRLARSHTTCCLMALTAKKVVKARARMFCINE